MHEASVVLARLRNRFRLQAAIVLGLSLLLAAVAVAMLATNRISGTAIGMLFVGAVCALYGLWHVALAPRWLARPDEIERIDHNLVDGCVHGILQISMIDGKTHRPTISSEECEALLQRCTEIRLRARVVKR